MAKKFTMSANLYGCDSDGTPCDPNTTDRTYLNIYESVNDIPVPLKKSAIYFVRVEGEPTQFNMIWVDSDGLNYKTYNPADLINTSISQLDFTKIINISNKGDGDIITHDFDSNFRIVSFWDSDDGGRKKDIFYSSSITTSQFTLKNDFETTKFNGTLLCVKY